MSARFFDTGIEELNTLLFGAKGIDVPKFVPAKNEEEIKEAERLTNATSILIRGGQGAGKTTLALQILNHQFPKKDEPPSNDSKTYGLFVSLEREADIALTNASLNLGMSKLAVTTGRFCERGMVLGVGGGEFREQLRKEFDRRSAAYWIVRSIGLIAFLCGCALPFLFGEKKVIIVVLALGGFISSLFFDIQILEKGVRWLHSKLSNWQTESDAKNKAKKTEEFDNVLADALCKFFDEDLKKRRVDNAADTLWIIIDSLNVLERAIFQRTQLEKYRGAMQGLATALHKKLGMKVRVLFTGEYHSPDHDVSGASGESFFCDVEILLSQEPLVGKARTDPRNSAAAGFNIELHHDEKIYPHSVTATQREQLVVETRSFCRVLKSRFGKNQSRRCFYKVEPGVGFVFDPVFPGDGHMLLFEDNSKQREDWEVFLLKDGPHEFPALRFELFDRTSQQRIFSTERSFRGHRRDTDLHMASLDTYWIKWFRELNERFVISEELRRFQIREDISRAIHADTHIPATDKPKEIVKRFANTLCHIHKSFGGIKSEKSDRIADTKNYQHLTEGFKKQSRLTDPKTLGRLEGILQCCWERFRSCNGMLIPLKWDGLRLYGEDCSELLPELASRSYIDNAFQPRTSDEPDRRLLSVPFNANVSFLVRRVTSRNKPSGRKGEESVKNDLRWKSLSAKLQELLDAERKDLGKFFNDFWGKFIEIRFKEIKSEEEIKKMTSVEARKAEWEKVKLDLFGNLGAVLAAVSGTKGKKPVNPEKNACDLLAQRMADGEQPLTWEEIIVLCEEGIVGGEKCNSHVVLETRGFDTLLCTFLEFAWGCGADLSVDQEYQISEDPLTFLRLYQAISLFRRMLIKGIIPKDSTVDPQIFGPRYSLNEIQDPKAEDWMFMRHWHSTLVDVLIAKDSKDNYLWNPQKGTELEIMPLPQSFWQLHRDHKFKSSDFRNTGKLIKRIIEDPIEATRMVSNRLKSKLEAIRLETKSANESGSYKLPTLIKNANDIEEFTSRLNQILTRQIFDEDDFKNIKLTKGTESFANWIFRTQKTRLPKNDRIRMNRWLLEEAYPQLIDRSRGISCWGEWHLAVLEGSENVPLAVELVNNLMSSSKISARALRGAALPVVEEFYSVYENSPCVLLYERAEEQIKLPEMTYGELRNTIFSCAQSRAKIFDYRHCMREFHGFLVDLIHNPEMEDKELGEKLLAVLRRISELRNYELLVH